MENHFLKKKIDNYSYVKMWQNRQILNDIQSRSDIELKRTWLNITNIDRYLTLFFCRFISRTIDGNIKWCFCEWLFNLPLWMLIQNILLFFVNYFFLYLSKLMRKERFFMEVIFFVSLDIVWKLNINLVISLHFSCRIWKPFLLSWMLIIESI